jgi:segregation and condensation protein B
MFGTTKGFLDYFGLKKLDDLPPLADLSDWESLRVQLNLPEVEDQAETGAEEAVDAVVSELPVLYPGDSEEEYPDEDAVAEALAKAEAVEGIPELQPKVEEPVEEESDEELVVNEWPDPVA